MLLHCRHLSLLKPGKCSKVCLCEYTPECGNTIAGGPAHHEAPLWIRAPLKHFIHAVSRPHLTHSDLSLYLKMSRPDKEKRKHVRLKFVLFLSH